MSALRSGYGELTWCTIHSIGGLLVNTSSDVNVVHVMHVLGCYGKSQYI